MSEATVKLVQENSEIKDKCLNLQNTVYETSNELNEVWMALNELTEDYDTSFKLNIKDAMDYCQGNKENSVGEESWKFLAESKRIMWLARVAKRYCEQAQKICEGVLE